MYYCILIPTTNISQFVTIPSHLDAVPSDGAVADSMAIFATQALGWQRMNVVLGSDGARFDAFLLLAAVRACCVNA